MGRARTPSGGRTAWHQWCVRGAGDDDLADVRADVDGLMKAVQELTARHQDLADPVAALADRDGRPIDTDDGADPRRSATGDRGFQ